MNPRASVSASPIASNAIDPHFVYAAASSPAIKAHIEPKLGEYFDFFYDKRYTLFLFATQFTQSDPTSKIATTFYAGLHFDEKEPEKASVAIYNKRLIKQLGSRTLEKELPAEISRQLREIHATYQRLMDPTMELNSESPIESAAGTPSRQSTQGSGAAAPSAGCCSGCVVM